MGKIKNYMMKKMVQSQMKNAPKDQQDQIMTLIDEHPELFEKITKEIKQEMKNGKDQMSASMLVMKKYQGELQKAMKK